MKKLNLFIIFSLWFILIVSNVFAAESKPVNNPDTGFTLVPESIRVKTYLEEILINRLNQELSTILDKQSFTLGIQLDLIDNPTKKVEEKAADEPINDLMIGSINPDEIMKKYSIEDSKSFSILANYKIKFLTVNVGLKEDINSTVKTEVEKWLTERLTNEFGKNSKGNVSFIKMPDKKNTVPKNWIDFLNQYQNFAGQAVLAMTLLLIAILWKLLATRSSVKFAPAGEFPTLNINGGKSEAAMNTQMKMEQMQQEKENTETIKTTEEIEKISKKINELTVKLGSELEGMVKSWCQTGEPGKLKLACFAESVGRDLGKLPIPVDSLTEVSKVFANMMKLTLKEKLDNLQKVYWDLMTVMNIGNEALAQPFSYLGSMNLESISQILIDQNPKLKTVISLYLPEELRIKYLKSLSVEAKKEILDTAISLNEIESKELKSADSKILGKLRPSAGDKEFIPLEMSFNKIINALSPLEEVLLLSEMDHPGLSNFKRATPTVAFLHEWPDDKLQLLLNTIPTDELTVYLRVKEEHKDRFLMLAPPFTAEVVIDELAKPDKLTENEKNLKLEALTLRIKAMVDAKQIFLEEVFVTFTQDMIDAITKAS